MRQLLAWSFAAAVFAALLVPTDAFACHNTMYRHYERMVVKKTVQEQAWASIRNGKFKQARKQLERKFPHLNPLRVSRDHVGPMAKSQRDALHALAVTYVRTMRHMHWSTQVLEELDARKTPNARAHLAEAYVLSDAAEDRDRGWAMLETLNRDRELSDPYTLTMLAVIRIQAGDVTGGRRAFATAEALRKPDYGETVCCVVGTGHIGRGYGGIGLGKIGTIGEPKAEPKM